MVHLENASLSVVVRIGTKVAHHGRCSPFHASMGYHGNWSRCRTYAFPFPLPFSQSLSIIISLTGFVKDLLTNPSTRGVRDVRHQVAAIASSSSLQKAADFCAKVKAPHEVKLYASYAELVVDSDIDIVYIATPVSHHFQNAMMAIEAGKAVLCEKALTVTASQARALVTAARARRVFLLEAVWTRFFPLCAKIRALVASGAIGTVYRVMGKYSCTLLHTRNS